MEAAFSPLSPQENLEKRALLWYDELISYTERGPNVS